MLIILLIFKGCGLSVLKKMNCLPLVFFFRLVHLKVAFSIFILMKYGTEMIIMNNETTMHNQVCLVACDFTTFKTFSPILLSSMRWRKWRNAVASEACSINNQAAYWIQSPKLKRTTTVNYFSRSCYIQ